LRKKLGKIDILASEVDSLALDVELLKLKVLPNDVKESKTLNAIQVRIDKNVRMLAELHAWWEREDEMARNMKVCTITTSSNVVSDASNLLTLIGVEKMSVFWIPGYPGPPTPGPLQWPSFGPGVERRPKPAEKTLMRRRLMRRTMAKTTKG
jgi:hypothetical protein